MGYYCTVPQCTSLAGKTKNVKFHRFPRDVIMADKWNIILRRGKPYTKYSKVCSLHFTQADYNVTTMGQWKTLSKDAVPSQNLPKLNPDGSVMVIRKTRTVKYKEHKKDDVVGEKTTKWTPVMPTHNGLPLTGAPDRLSAMDPQDSALSYRLQKLNDLANIISPHHTHQVLSPAPSLSTPHTPQKPKKQDAIMQTDPINPDDEELLQSAYSEGSEKSYSPDQMEYSGQYPKEQDQGQYAKEQYTKDQSQYTKGQDYSKDQGQYTKDQGQYTKDQGQYTKDQGQYTKDQGQYTKDQGQYTKDQGQYTKDQGQYTKEQGQYTKDQGQYTKEQGQYTKDQGQYTKDQTQYTKDQGQYTKEQGQYTKDQGQYTKDQGHYTKDQGNNQYTKDQGQYTKDQGPYTKDQGQYTKDQGQYTKDQGQYPKDQGQYTKDQSQYTKDQGQYSKDQGQYTKDQDGFKEDYGRKKFEAAKDYTKPTDDYIPQTNEEYNKEAEKYALERKSHNGYEKGIDYQKPLPIENGYAKMADMYAFNEKQPAEFEPRTEGYYQGGGYTDSADLLRSQQHNLQMLQEPHRINENQNFFNENHIKQEIDFGTEEDKFLYERSKEAGKYDSEIHSTEYDRQMMEQRLLQQMHHQVKQEPDTGNGCESVVQPQTSPYYNTNGHTNVTGGYYESSSRPGPELLIAKQNALAAHTQLWQNTMKRPFFYSDSSHYNAPQLLHRYEAMAQSRSAK